MKQKTMGINHSKLRMVISNARQNDLQWIISFQSQKALLKLSNDCEKDMKIKQVRPRRIPHFSWYYNIGMGVNALRNWLWSPYLQCLLRRQVFFSKCFYQRFWENWNGYLLVSFYSEVANNIMRSGICGWFFDLTCKISWKVASHRTIFSNWNIYRRNNAPLQLGTMEFI